MSAAGPVFVMSSERSGSNLLRTLLSNHPALSAPMAAQLLATFGPERELYAPLSERENALSLARDMLATANHKQFGWDLEVDPARVIDGLAPPDFLGVFDAVYRAEMARKEARRYVCKENQIFRFAPELAQRFPEARFLYLHRDPRDYAASWTNVPLLNHTPHESARVWRTEQTAALAAAEELGERIHRLGYEELIADPDATMTRVLGFLGEETDPSCFEVQEGKNAAATWSSFWKNLDRPVMRGNARKWEQAFDADTVAMIETLAAGPMEALGYQRTTLTPWRPGPLFAVRERLRARREDRRLRREHADTVAVLLDRRALVDGLFAARRNLRKAPR